jgi:hypothetical protein
VDGRENRQQAEMSNGFAFVISLVGAGAAVA